MWFLLSQLRKVAVSGAKITAKESRTSGLLLLTVVIRLRERRSPDATTVLSSCPVCWLFYILCVLLVAGISATGHLQQTVMHAFTHPLSSEMQCLVPVHAQAMTSAMELHVVRCGAEGREKVVWSTSLAGIAHQELTRQLHA